MSHIVVEGPIGVGKTTLTKRIAKEFGFDELLEQPAENPFLERFYEQPDQYAMQTQLYFLFQRVKQLRGLSQTDLFSSGVV
jgi:deoxyguanosine kinase